MSLERVEAEIQLLKQRYPDVEVRDDGWCRLARYALPDGWSESEVGLVFRVPPNVPGEIPYAFWTKLLVPDARGRRGAEQRQPPARRDRLWAGLAAVVLAA